MIGPFLRGGGRQPYPRRGLAGALGEPGDSRVRRGGQTAWRVAAGRAPEAASRGISSISSPGSRGRRSVHTCWSSWAFLPGDEAVRLAAAAAGVEGAAGLGGGFGRRLDEGDVIREVAMPRAPGDGAGELGGHRSSLP
ncbi:hypothetical protein SSBG_03136 [Streptomyces sp. SPB074]|nr:hypothetical protein SSBG_03136 [Streptomyces sp. SPB074]